MIKLSLLLLIVPQLRPYSHVTGDIEGPELDCFTQFTLHTTSAVLAFHDEAGISYARQHAAAGSDKFKCFTLHVCDICAVI